MPSGLTPIGEARPPYLDSACRTVRRELRPACDSYSQEAHAPFEISSCRLSSR